MNWRGACGIDKNFLNGRRWRWREGIAGLCEWREWKRIDGEARGWSAGNEEKEVIWNGTRLKTDNGWRRLQGMEGNGMMEGNGREAVRIIWRLTMVEEEGCREMMKIEEDIREWMDGWNGMDGMDDMIWTLAIVDGAVLIDDGRELKRTRWLVCVNWTELNWWEYLCGMLRREWIWVDKNGWRKRSEWIWMEER